MNYSRDIIWIKIRDYIMMDNNLNINNNSMVPLTSINYNSNQHRESSPKNYARFNTIVTSGWSGDDGAGGDFGVDDDDDPDEVYIDDGVDGDDLHSPGRNFPRRNLSAGEHFLSQCLPPHRGVRIFL